VNNDAIAAHAITKERLAGWARQLDDHTATPVLLVGIGIGPRRGQIVILVPDDPRFDQETIKGVLKKALAELGG
jgi:hypothetical protein